MKNVCIQGVYSHFIHCDVLWEDIEGPVPKYRGACPQGDVSGACPQGDVSRIEGPVPKETDKGPVPKETDKGPVPKETRYRGACPQTEGRLWQLVFLKFSLLCLLLELLRQMVFPPSASSVMRRRRPQRFRTRRISGRCPVPSLRSGWRTSSTTRWRCRRDGPSPPRGGDRPREPHGVGEICPFRPA